MHINYIYYIYVYTYTFNLKVLYILLFEKCQVKSHSFPSFSAAGVAAIVHRNHYFWLYQQNKFSQSKVKFRYVSNCCKKVLEAAKLAYANKTKESINFLKFGELQIAIRVLSKGKYTIPPLFDGLELSSASGKTKLFMKNIYKNFNLEDSGISLPVFPFRINLKLHNISGTSAMVKKMP